MHLPFLLAATLALVTCAVHVFAGGAHVVRPLLAASDITRASRWLNYYCWHIVTLLILVMAACFGLAARDPAFRDLAVLFTLLAGGLSVLSATVALRGGVGPHRFPSTSLFAAIALSGVWGLTS